MTLWRWLWPSGILATMLICQVWPPQVSVCVCVCVCPRRGENVKKRAGQCRSRTSRLVGLLRWHDGAYSVRDAPRFKAQLEFSHFQPPTPCGEQKLLMAWVCVCVCVCATVLERWREQASQMLASAEVTLHLAMEPLPTISSHPPFVYRSNKLTGLYKIPHRWYFSCLR